MNRFILTLSAASALVLAGAVSAGQPLTSAQMDGITAGGSATGSAYAEAYGVLTAINHAVTTSVIPTGNVYQGELGAIFELQSNADSGSDATAQTPYVGTAFGAGASSGQTVGTGLSDTDNNTAGSASTLLDLGAPVFPFATGSAYGTGAASSVIIGTTASSLGTSSAAATLGN
jgi:hypothetical protein